jgi:hypothetical protein
MIMKTKRERLEDVIMEYLDEEYSSRLIYEEFLSVMMNECQGREEASKKALELRDLMLGDRPVF